MPTTLQANKPNNNKGIIALLLLLVLLVSLLIFGCNPIKKIEREDNKAVQRVLGKYDLQVPIVNQWLKAHPQDTTTKIIYTQGETKTITQLVKDTIRENKIKDSLLAIGKDCGEAAINAFDIGYDQAEHYYLKNPIVRVDTKTIERGVTKEEYNRMVDTAGLFAKQLLFTKGQLDYAQNNAKLQEKRNDSYILTIIILSTLLTLSVVFNVRNLISPKKIIDSIKNV